MCIPAAFTAVERTGNIHCIAVSNILIYQCIYRWIIQLLYFRVMDYLNIHFYANRNKLFVCSFCLSCYFIQISRHPYFETDLPLTYMSFPRKPHFSHTLPLHLSIPVISLFSPFLPFCDRTRN